MSTVDVLVVGAGPVGLALALDVVAHGGTARVIDRRAGSYRPSRAMLVQPRTLEQLRPLGVVEQLLARGGTAPGADLHVGRRVVPVQLGEIPWRGTAFPHLTFIRQLAVEQVLLKALADRGVEVQWGSELIGLSEPHEDVVRASIRTARGSQVPGARFVVGCDGTGSTVRGLLGIDWPGRYYPVEVVLADVELAGAVTPRRLQVAVGSGGLVFVFPLGEEAPWRILATRERRAGTPGLGEESVPLRELAELVEQAGLGATVTRVAWSSRIPLQHRLAARFGSGRVFLAGDAAHSHSPAAAQGMNSGIQDATNLGWKLAFAARSGLGPGAPLLASYQLERRPVARQVLALTDAVFAAEASTALPTRLLRGHALPLVAPLLPVAIRQPLLMQTVLWILSQGWVRYRSSPLSLDADRHAAGPRPGDQLRDAEVACDGRRVRLHELTASPGVHLLGSPDGPAATGDRGGYVHGHPLQDWPAGSVVAIRPDGHVGLRGTTEAALRVWLGLVGLAPSRPDGVSRGCPRPGPGPG